MNSHRALPQERRERDRSLRREATSAERLLWSRLRAGRLGGAWPVRRQVPIGRFIVDFACHAARLVIEVDGAAHCTDEERAQDARREGFLRSVGYEVLRCTNDEVFSNLDGGVETIRLKLVERAPHLETPEPRGGKA